MDESTSTVGAVVVLQHQRLRQRRHKICHHGILVQNPTALPGQLPSQDPEWGESPPARAPSETGTAFAMTDDHPSPVPFATAQENVAELVLEMDAMARLENGESVGIAIAVEATAQKAVVCTNEA